MKRRILVQQGHVAPRDPNHENETGANGEQELVQKIAPLLARRINADPRMEAVVVPGLIPRGIKCDAAIFLHGDGSSNPRASGYCFGYPPPSINKRLADLIADEFDKLPGHPLHRRDNYTAGLRHYYGYSRVDTIGPEVVVEHGFLSNPRERAWLFANADKLAFAEYRALLRFFGMPPPNAPPPIPKSFKWAYRVVEANGSDTFGKTNWPGIVTGRIARRNPRQITLERL